MGRSYLAGVRDMAAVPVTVMTNAKNVGFPAAINQGSRGAAGYLVLLNNDVVVTDGWLDQLVALTNARTDGVTSPGRPGRAVARLGDLPPTPLPEGDGGARVDGPQLRAVRGWRGLGRPPGPNGRAGFRRLAIRGLRAVAPGPPPLIPPPGGGHACRWLTRHRARWAYVELCGAAAVGRGACRIAI